MDFGVLGPVEVRMAGALCPVGSGRQRFVLAMLLLNADRLTLASHLVDAMWAEPPRSARAQVHNLVSDLRKRLGPDAAALIVSRPSGYELRLGGHTLDLVEFRQRMESARAATHRGEPAVAMALAGEALALWRGSALADVADDLVGPVRLALEEERLAAVELRLEAGIALGRYDEVLADAGGLTDQHPYRERLWWARIGALAGTGRTADALDAFRQVRERLGADLGVDPGPDLQGLQRQILRGEFDPAPRDTGPVRPGQLPPLTTVTVTGRDHLLAEVARTLGRPPTLGGRVCVLTGPGGVGKTTVALAVAHRLAGSFGGGQLYADLRGSHAEPADPHQVTGRFLRALGVAGAQIPPDRDERVALYRSLLVGTHTLIVLDDAVSEGQVRPLLPGTAGNAVLVTSRRRLAAVMTDARWDVPVLEADDSAVLLGRIAGAGRIAAEPDAAAAIVRLCGQLPLAVCVAAARLSVHPHWTLDEFRVRLAAERQRLNELTVGDLDVRASIGLSYRSLDAGLRRLVRRLGLVVAPDWPAWVASEVAATPGVERLLDHLMDVHLVESAGIDAVGQRRFRMHDLVAVFAAEAAVDEDDQVERRGAVERVLARWLAATTYAMSVLGSSPAAATRPSTAPIGAAPMATAGERPLDWLEAERGSLTSAVQQGCREGFAVLAGETALRAAGFLAQRAHNDDWLSTLRAATACVRTDGPDPLRLRLLDALFAASLGRSRSADLLAIAEEQLDLARRLDDRTAVVSALVNAGWAQRKGGRLAESAQWLEQALATADEQVPLRLRTRALQGLALVHREAGRYALAIPFVQRALALERAQGRPRDIALCLINYAAALTDAGQADQADQAFTEAIATAGDLSATDLVICLADLDRRRHRWDAAAARFQDALAFAEAHTDHSGAAEAMVGLADVATGRGEPCQALRHLRAAVRLWRRLERPLESARALARLDQALTLTAVSDDDHAEAAACRQEWQGILAELDLDVACLRLAS